MYKITIKKVLNWTENETLCPDINKYETKGFVNQIKGIKCTNQRLLFQMTNNILLIKLPSTTKFSSQSQS